MSLHVWLILFIISMGGSAEVLAWAVHNGQFVNLKRGNVMPLRAAGATAVPVRPRAWRMLLLWLIYGLFALYFLDWLGQLLHLAYA